MSVDKLVVQTKEKMDQKIRSAGKRLPGVGSNKYDTIELPITNNDVKNKYDTEGVNNLLESEQNLLSAKDVNLDVNKAR